MPKLWLTYAWTDNQDSDVDFVAQELERRGIDVSFDRVHLVAGRRLWDQIDKAISDPAISDAWAIFVTNNSLKSEACQEELAIALDRALRKRGGEYPLIGIFPSHVDRERVPSAIATRLWVQLDDSSWSEQIAATLKREARPKPAQVEPYHARKHIDQRGNTWIEVRPRAETWYPGLAFVPAAEKATLPGTMPGPPGRVPATAVYGAGEINGDFRGAPIFGHTILQPITNQTSMYIQINGAPSVLFFGSETQQYAIDPAVVPFAAPVR